MGNKLESQNLKDVQIESIDNYDEQKHFCVQLLLYAERLIKQQKYEDAQNILNKLGKALSTYNLSKDSIANIRMHSNFQWSKLMEHGFRAYNKSMDYLKQALELSKKLGEKISEANILAEMGYMERRRKDYSASLEYYCMAVEIFVQNGELGGQSATYNNIGVVYNAMQKYENAAECFKKVLELTQKLGDVNAQCCASGNIGDVYCNMKKYEEALPYYQTQLLLCQKKKNKRGEAKAFSDLGTVYRNIGDHDQSLKCHLSDLQISQEVLDQRGIGRSYNNIANTYISQLNYLEAINYFQKSILIWENNNDIESKRITFNGMGIAYSELGEFKDSMDMFCKALEISCIMKDETMQKTIVKNICWLDGKLMEKQIDPFDINDKAINYFIEKGKEEITLFLSDNLNSSKVCSLMDVNSKKNEHSVVSLSPCLVLENYNRALTVDPIQPDTVFIHYCFSYQGVLRSQVLHTWGISSDEDTLYVRTPIGKFIEQNNLPFRKEKGNLLEILIKNYSTANTKKEENEVPVTAQIMYDLLVAPVKQLISKNTKFLVFVPCDGLWSFPFHSLIDSSSNQLLISKLQFLVVPSFRIFCSLYSKVSHLSSRHKLNLESDLLQLTGEKYQKAVIFANLTDLYMPQENVIKFEGIKEGVEDSENIFESEKKLEQLTLSEREASAIQNVLTKDIGVQSVNVYSKDKFSATFFTNNVIGCKYVHISTYGTLKGEIVFSGKERKDSILDPKIVSCLSLSDTSLVVLSLRYTSISDFRDFISLSYSFINAGSRFVLLSLPNSDEKTLIKHIYLFYCCLAENKDDVPLAFQLSTLKLAKESEGSLLSSFILLGC